MSEDIEKAFKGQAPGYSKHVGYTRYVNGKAIRVEGGAQPHQKVTLAAPGSVKHKGGEFLDRLHSYVHKKAPTTEHELQEAVHRFVHGKFEGDEKSLQKFHAEGLKELSKHGLVTHHEPKAKRGEEKEVPKKGSLSPKEQAARTAKWVKDNEDKTGLRPKLAGWQYNEGSKIQAPVSTKDDYVISHRKAPEGKERHNVSYRPTGKHEHVGEYPTAKEAVAAADAHAGSLKKKPRKEAPHPADQELAERKKEKPSAYKLGETYIPPRSPSVKTMKQKARKEEAARSATETRAQAPSLTLHEPKAVEPLSDSRRSAESLLKVPTFEEATHRRLSALAKHPNAKKRAIAKLAERIASKPEGVSHRDLANEVKELEARHGIAQTTLPEEIGYHEPAVQRILETFSSSKTLLDSMAGRLAEPHVKANAYEAARRLNESQGKEVPPRRRVYDATPAPAQPAAKPAPKAEEKPATSAAAPKIGKFDEGSVRYLVEHMSESELRSRLPQASDSIKNNVNEALRRIAEKKEEKTS